LCPDSGKPFPIENSIKVLLDKQFDDLPTKYKNALPPFKEFYHAAPTEECPNGTRGRTGVFEILKMNSEVEQVLLKEPVEEKIYTAARASGMLTMREDAIIKALAGEIPFEEVNVLGGELFPGGDIT
jgi:type II secretory ATPase GspE/PulE/Tfp pilus assembly ATPase PilB-like protein